MNCSKSTSVIKAAMYYEICGQFLLHKGSHHVCTTTISTLFAVNKNELVTKDDTGKSMSITLYQGTSWAEAMLNSEKIKPIAIFNHSVTTFENNSGQSESLFGLNFTSVLLSSGEIEGDCGS